MTQTTQHGDPGKEARPPRPRRTAFAGLLVLKRVVDTTLRSMARNLLLTLATIITISAMLGSVLLMLSAGALGDHARVEISKRITISLEVRDTASLQEVDALKQALVQYAPPHVSVQYLSRDDARRELEDSGVPIPDFIDPGTFVARLRITIDDLKLRDPLLNFVASSPRFKDIVTITEREHFNSSYSEKVQSIDRVIGSAQRVGVTLATLFALLSALVVAITVRLTIHTRRDELAIMQLVGASRSSIIGPFVLESALDGIIAAGIALGLFAPMVQLIFPGLEGFFEGFSVQQYLTADLPQLMLTLVGIGGGLGIVSSLVSTAWYLRKQPVL